LGPSGSGSHPKGKRYNGAGKKNGEDKKKKPASSSPTWEAGSAPGVDLYRDISDAIWKGRRTGTKEGS